MEILGTLKNVFVVLLKVRVMSAPSIKKKKKKNKEKRGSHVMEQTNYGHNAYPENASLFRAVFLYCRTNSGRNRS